VGLTSHLKSRTDLNVTYRVIDPFFQSLGVGFLRSGTRAIDLTVTQAIGSRLRFQGGYRIEDRDAPGTEVAAMRIQRLRARVTYRLLKGLILRGGYTPIEAKPLKGSSSPGQRSSMVQFGADLRQRHGHTIWSIMADVSRYRWSLTGEAERPHDAWYCNLGSSLSQDRWMVSVYASSLVANNDSLTASPIGCDLQVTYRAERGWECTGQLNGAFDMPDLGWRITGRRSLGKRIFITGAAGHIRNLTNYSINDVGTLADDNYTCQLGIGFKW
jgi:hypothetical protein